MDKYACTASEYIYDTAKEDPEHGKPQGTAFKNVPRAWVCAAGGAPKSALEKAVS